MARIRDDQTVELAGFPRGLDNLSDEHKIATAALREAINVDLDGSGWLSRRDGYTRVLTGSFHSIFADGEVLYGVRDGTLASFDANYAQTDLVTDIGDMPVSYARLGWDVYWSTATQNGVVMANGDAASVWPASPAQPALQAQATGGLSEGTYQVAITTRDLYGRESGAGQASTVELTSAGGILVTGLPNLAEFVAINLYVSPPNGDVLYFSHSIPMGVNSTTVVAGERGRALGPRQWWKPMPAGQALAAYNGRLLVASGNRLTFSEPMAFGATAPDNYLTFAADIDLLAPVGEAAMAGLYLAAGNRTMYLNGPNLKAASQVIARPVGAVPGTMLPVHTSSFAASLPDIEQTTAAMWLSTDGVFCLGLPGGRVLPLTQRRMTAPKQAGRGALYLREADGENTVVAAVQGGDLTRAAASAQLVGTVYRGGIEV